MTAPTVTPVQALVARQRAQAAESEGALLEQRHALLDLDADSDPRFTLPGACCVNCPPREEEKAA